MCGRLIVYHSVPLQSLTIFNDCLFSINLNILVLKNIIGRFIQ